MRKMHLLEGAVLDLDDAAAFYDEMESGLRDWFYSTLLSEVRLLATFAGSHRKRFGFHCYVSKRFPFGVYYEVEDDAVNIYAILDHRSNPRVISRILRGR